MVEYASSAPSQLWRSHTSTKAPAWTLDSALTGRCSRGRSTKKSAHGAAGGIVITANGVSLIENVEAAILAHPVTGFDVVAFVVHKEASVLAACDPGAHATICFEGTPWSRIEGGVEVIAVDSAGRRRFRDQVRAALGRTEASAGNNGDVIVVVHPERLEPRTPLVAVTHRTQPAHAAVR